MLFSVTVFSFVNKVYVVNSGTLCYTDDIYTDVFQWFSHKPVNIRYRASVFFASACNELTKFDYCATLLNVLVYRM